MTTKTTQMALSTVVAASMLCATPTYARTIAPPEPLEKRVDQAEKVFVGVLVKRTLLPGDWCHGEIQVTRALKGAKVGDLVSVIWRPGISGYDALEKQQGLAVLKYAHKGRYWLRPDTFEDPKLATQVEEIMAAADKQRLAELDAYWAEVARSVTEGDFAGYKATCHPEGVLVSGVKGMSQPLADALARWKKEFDATKAGTMKASVEFRIGKRLGDATTAHETGIFRYQASIDNGKKVDEYIHLEALLVKKEGQWLIVMEYQKSKATLEEWEALK